MPIPVGLKPGDKLGSVVGKPDPYGKLWLTTSPDRYSTTLLTCKSITVYQGSNSLWAEGLLQRGDIYQCNLDNVEHVVRLEDSIWEPLSKRRERQAEELHRWEQKAKLAVGLIVIAVTCAVTVVAIGLLTDWTFDITPPFNTADLMRLYESRRIR